MLVTFNTEWLAWIIEAPPEIYFHDQEVAEQKDDGTSIP